MKKIIQNPFINAFLVTIIISGLIHDLILWLKFIKTWNWNVFNYFQIIELDFFWKEIAGINTLIISWLMMIGIYFCAWYFYSNKIKK